MHKLFKWTLRALCSLVLLGIPHSARAVPFEKILNGGDPQNRVDIAIVGDGYTAGEMAKYKADVQAFFQAVFQQEPYKEYKNYFNVWRLDVASAESGADHPERFPPVARNTAFGAAYNCAGIQRLICVDVGAVMNVLSSTLAPAQYDIKVVIVNDPEYGGSGGSVAVASTHEAAVEVILHEVGHSFALLADEYTSQPPPCDTTAEPPQVNATMQTQRASIKWGKWIAAATPVPTLSTTPGVPGLYQGARYCPAGLYRPTYSSKMRSLGAPFEQINVEQHVRRIYNFVSPVDSYSPAQSSLTLPSSGSQVFKVNTPAPLTHALGVKWFVDNQLRATGPQFTLDTTGLAAGVPHTVRADVADATTFVRNDPGLLLTESQSWTVNLINCSYSLSQTGKSFGAAGGGGSVSVTAGGGCGWTAKSNASWVAITSGDSGTGGGAVSYTVQANAAAAPRSGTMTIAGKTYTVSQSAAHGLSVGDVTVTEANTTAATAAFTVKLSQASTSAVTVKYATASGTALAPSDYAALPLTQLTFDPGQTVKTVTVQVRGDIRDETAETFRLRLSAPAGAVITDGEGVCTVTDNDPAPSINITNVTVTEPDSGTVNATFTVRLSAASGQTVSVKYATANGTTNPAAAGTDYTAVALTTLTFPPGQNTKTVTVQVRGDLAKELNETFFVNLSAAVNATISDAQGLGTILNDD